MHFKEAREVINYVLEKTADMSRPAFYATMGTILKMYSLQKDIPMLELIGEFTKGIVDAEADLGNEDFSDIRDKATGKE